MELFFICILVAYYALVLFLIAGWRKALRISPYQGGGRFAGMITVVVAMRNEEENIGRLLDDLFEQYDDAMEIVLVDDHSEDGTTGVVRRKIRGQPAGSARLLSPAAGYGKKNALEYGIKHAKGAVIVTTDADCRVGRQWLAGIRRWFGDENTKFVFGGVKIGQDGSWWAAMQAIEFSSLVGTGAATWSWGFPTMCNGANLAFRKEVFSAVGGYAGNRHIPSGDDEFLLRKVFARYPRGIRFNNDPLSVVHTRAQVGFAGFFQQRVRWAGKWKSHRAPAGILLALFIFLVHMAFVFMVPWALLAGKVGFLAVSLLIKSALELIFLQKVVRFLGVSWSWPAFIIQEMLYSLYAVTFGIMANGRAFRWKGRKLATAAR